MESKGKGRGTSRSGRGSPVMAGNSRQPLLGNTNVGVMDKGDPLGMTTTIPKPTLPVPAALLSRDFFKKPPISDELHRDAAEQTSVQSMELADDDNDMYEEADPGLIPYEENLPTSQPGVQDWAQDVSKQEIFSSQVPRVQAGTVFDSIIPPSKPSSSNVSSAVQQAFPPRSMQVPVKKEKPYKGEIEKDSYVRNMLEQILAKVNSLDERMNRLEGMFRSSGVSSHAKILTSKGKTGGLQSTGMGGMIPN